MANYLTSPKLHHRNAIIPNAPHHFVSDGPPDLRISYVDTGPSPSSKGTILLVHGFPQTGYKFRKVVHPLASAKYRVIIPDYRGAGGSSKPVDLNGYHKITMATDLHNLLHSYLFTKEPVHVVGHDIGGMIAHAYASQYPEDTASLAREECPLPGTAFYNEIKNTMSVWHFTFHNVIDLPEFLTAGREREYLKHFYDRPAHNTSAITPQDVDYYAAQYSQVGGMRAGFNVYRMFESDAEDSRKMVGEKGKCKIRCSALNGAESFLRKGGESKGKELYEDVRTANVEESGHWIAEENPDGFVRELLKWIEQD